MVELLSVGRSKLPSKYPQLSSALRKHHSLGEERDRSGPPCGAQLGPRPRDAAEHHTRWPQPAPMLSDHLPQSEGRGLKNPAFGRSSAVRHPPHVPEFLGGKRTQASPGPVPADPAASDARKGSTTSGQSTFFSNTETKAAGPHANPFPSCVGRASTTPPTNPTRMGRPPLPDTYSKGQTHNSKGNRKRGQRCLWGRTSQRLGSHTAEGPGEDGARGASVTPRLTRDEGVSQSATGLGRLGGCMGEASACGWSRGPGVLGCWGGAPRRAPCFSLSPLLLLLSLSLSPPTCFLSNK